MKVTISFNGTKIVVPCGEGDISVQELTDLAATRYKKAIGKTNAYWVSVHSLKSHEGGILDPDDLICDVCDDREQLAAIYDEQNGGHYHGGGDGMSSASDSDIKESLGGSSSLSSNDTLLQVRRGSEPSLHKPCGSSDNIVDAASSGSVQAVIASINARSVSISSAASSVTSMAAASNTVSRSLSSNEIIMMQQQQHLRSSLRKTMVNTQFGYFDQSEMDQDSRATLQQSSPDSQYGEGCDNNSGSLSVMRRREPLGASGNKPERPKSPSRLKPPPAIEAIDANGGEVLFDIVILNEIGPLGVHVVPCDTDGRLIVQGIEPGGRIDRDGRLAVSDCIVAINGYPLQDTTFNKAQEIFKEALYAKELRLKILRNSNAGALISSSVDDIKDHNNAVEGSNCNTKSNTLTRKTEMAAGTKITSAVNANNTRKIGKLLKISLRKGTQGLGFSITTRDNALGDNTPIYIKNIMPKGAAIEDGTLKPGDRLLEVNNECVDGMSQSDVVTLLKSFSLDSMVNLVISRHAIASEESESNKSPSKATIPSTTTAAASSTLTSSTTATTSASQTTTTTTATASTTDAALLLVPPGRKLHFHLDNNDKTDEEPMDSLEPASSMHSSASPGISSDNYDDLTSAEDFSFPWKQREILTFDIPVHDSERAGLGVSVKGKTSTNKDGVIDLGIFVKSVLHGGAASRDGRLMTNDQLVSINGMSLLGKANPFAMETLRKAMHEEGPVPGIISLTVARKKLDDLQQPLSRTSNNLARRDSLSSLPTSSDDEIVREYHVTSQPQQQQQQPPAPASFKIPSTSSLKNTRNPVIDRLMGHDHAASASASVLPSNLRNESYYMATDGSHYGGHDVTWNGSMLQNNILFQPEVGHQQHPTSGGSPDSVFIEQPPIITASASTQSVDNDDDTTVTGGDDHVTTRESLTSLVDFYPAFARDQFGRQSMSEKRHATLDAKSTDTYQKRKKAREEREKSKTATSNWKKSASLESLQMHHEVKMDVNTMSSPYQRANSVRVSRNRGCNESFRAAVDRSYEKDFPEAAVTASDDFVIQDLGVGHGHHFNHPAALPTSSDQQQQQQPKVVMRRSKSGGQQNEDRKKNRNSKLLRGLGSMFKIGSNSIERTKDTKVMTRKSMPSPETLTNSASATSIASSSNNASTSTNTMSTVVMTSRGQTKSSSDIPSEPPNAHWMQQHYQNQQNQMRLHPQQYIPQQPQPHSRSHSQPRYHAAAARPNEMYEYMPSSMMRPGSRVGIAADPAGSTEIADYDVIQRLQNTHVQPQQQQPPPPPPSRPAPSAAYHYGYVQQYNLYNQYGYHQQALPQVAHPRTGSNLSSGSSNNGVGPHGGHQHHGHHKHSSRPKSNYYEYEMYNNNPASYMSTASSAASSSNSHYPSSSDHPQLQPGQPHPAMYSLPRSSSGY